MKKKISAILFGLLFLVGFGILVYPTVSNQWNTYRQSQLISNYQSVVQDMTPEDLHKSGKRPKPSMRRSPRTTYTVMCLARVQQIYRIRNTGRY